MTTRAPRFGLNLVFQSSTAQTIEEAKRAADVGFDVVLVPDHLGFQSPFPLLVAIADAVPSVRVSNLVINAALYRPALLARDLATVDSASGGRLDIGLGSGYVEQDFTGSGVPFPTARQRVDLLTEHVATIRELLSSPDYAPAPVQSPPPIMVAGIGDRLLSMAAQNVDIVAIAAQGPESELAERVEYVKSQAGTRFDQIELAFSFFQSNIDGSAPDLTLLKMLSPDSSEEDLLKSVTSLHGSVEQSADRISALREQYGITYFTLNYGPGTPWESLEKLLAAAK
jgi:probable F420-dependent oxidoreductase